MTAGDGISMTGLVLAGGRGRRMGRDKAHLTVAGRPLLERVATALERECAPVWVASGDGRRLAACRWPQLADAEGGAGPLGGILGGLERAPTDLLAVAAVDMPFASSAVLAFLASRWHGEAAVVPRVEGRLQPLHAVYAAAAAPPLRTLFDRGERSPTRALRQLGARVVEPAEWGRIDPSGRFALNLNTPEDLVLVTLKDPASVGRAGA